MDSVSPNLRHESPKILIEDDKDTVSVKDSIEGETLEQYRKRHTISVTGSSND
jgi:hypothetical protein